MAGQTSGTGSGTAHTNNAITELQTKIRAANNTRARMNTAFNGIRSQLQAAAGEGLPAVQAWLKNTYTTQGIQALLDAVEEAQGQSQGQGVAK